MDIIYYKTLDGIVLNGIMYKANPNSNKLVISVHGICTNCLKKREEIIAEK